MRRIIWAATILSVTLVCVLRLYRLDSLPAAPYWEEVAVAYDAYSILKTGADHHGNPFPVVALESFGDWKPAGYAYAQIPFIYTFGLSTFAARVPSAIASVFLALFVAFLSWKLTRSSIAGVTGILVAALSPWQIMFGRAAWEVTLATALFSWGAVCFYWALSTTKKYSILFQLLGLVMLWSSAYTYHAMRLLVPMLLSGLLFFDCISTINRIRTTKSKLSIAAFAHTTFRRYIPTVLISCAFILPFLLVWGKPQLQQRFAETSIFSDTSISVQRNTAVQIDGNSLVSRGLNHQIILFALRITAQYASHFSPSFLLFSGDTNIRHATGYGGMLYFFDALTITTGMYYLLQRRHTPHIKKWLVLPILILILAPIPASVTNATPHALRTLPMSGSLLSFSSIGLYHIVQFMYSKSRAICKLSKNQGFIVALLVCALYLAQPVAWLRHYTAVYAVTSEAEWQYGYAELIESVQKSRVQHPDYPVYITRSQGRPAMYLWFYSNEKPDSVQIEGKIAKMDQGEFLTYHEFTFFRSVSEIDGENKIIALTPIELDELRARFDRIEVLESIRGQSGNVLWEVVLIQ